MRTCMQGHPGCPYIGDARHESGAPKPPPTEDRVRQIVREEIDRALASEGLAQRVSRQIGKRTQLLRQGSTRDD